MAELLVTGHVVKLNSGGPHMTVTVVNGAKGDVQCSWIYDGDLRHAYFPIETLTAIVPVPAT